MVTKTITKKTKSKKEPITKKTETETKVKTKSKTPIAEKSAKKITFWPASTTREDKISLFSFCLGMVVMTCFFVLDLQIRDYFYKQDHSAQLKTLTRQIQNNRKSRHRVPTCNCNQPKCPKAHINKPVLKCPPVWQRQVAFNPQEYAPYDVEGTLTISGNVCNSLPKGAICPEKIDVFVNPKTSYSDEWWTKHWTGIHGISKVDERALKYNKQGSVQKNGQFSIEKLPAGTYYVGAAACVSTAPNKPCQETRWGAQVSIDKNTDVSLKHIRPKR